MSWYHTLKMAVLQDRTVQGDLFNLADSLVYKSGVIKSFFKHSTLFSSDNLQLMNA